jgi:hypothetical protein
MWKIDETTESTSRYYGNDTFTADYHYAYAEVFITDTAVLTRENEDSVVQLASISFPSVTFSNGGATKSANDGYISDGSGNIISEPGGNGSDPLNGTWDNGYSTTVTFNNGNWERSYDGKSFEKGPYSISGSSITMTITQIHGEDWYLLDSKWYTKAELKASGYASDENLDDMFGTITGTVSGNTLTLTYPDSKSETFTKNGTSGGGSNSGGTFTLTGIPLQYNGKWAYLEGVSNSVRLAGCQSFNMSTNTATLALISNGSVSIPMWLVGGSGDNPTFTAYSGNHSVEVLVAIADAAVTSNAGEPLAVRSFGSVAFSNGSAARDWSAGTDYDLSSEGSSGGGEGGSGGGGSGGTSK